MSNATINTLRTSIAGSSRAHANMLEEAKIHYTTQIEKLNACIANIRDGPAKVPEETDLSNLIKSLEAHLSKRDSRSKEKQVADKDYETRLRALDDCLAEVQKNAPSLSVQSPTPRLGFRERLGIGASGGRPVPDSPETEVVEASMLDLIRISVGHQVQPRMVRAQPPPIDPHPKIKYRIPRSPSPSPRKPPQPFWDHDSVGARGTRPVASTEPVRAATKRPTPPSLPRIPVESYQSQAPVSNLFARTGSWRQSSRNMRSADDDWSDSDDDESDIELQPKNVLIKPNRKIEGQVNPFTREEKRHKTPSHETLPGVKSQILKCLEPPAR